MVKDIPKHLRSLFLGQFGLGLYRMSDVLGRFYPFNVAGDATNCLHGLNDVAAGDKGFGSAFDNIFKGSDEIGAAVGNQADGFKVAAESPFGYIVVLGDAPELGPFDVFLFHQLAIGMAADLAFAAVAFEGGICFVFSEGLLSGTDYGGFSFRKCLVTFSLFVHVETSKPSLPEVNIKVNTYRSTRTYFPDLGLAHPS